MTELAGERENNKGKEFQSDHSLIDYPFIDVSIYPNNSPERRMAEFTNIMVFNHIQPTPVITAEEKKVIDRTSQKGWNYAIDTHDKSYIELGDGWLVKQFTPSETSPDYGVVILTDGTALFTVTNIVDKGNGWRPKTIGALPDDNHKNRLASMISQGSLNQYIEQTIAEYDGLGREHDKSRITIVLSAGTVSADALLDAAKRKRSDTEEREKAADLIKRTDMKNANSIIKEKNLAYEIVKAARKVESDNNALAFINIMNNSKIEPVDIYEYESIDLGSTQRDGYEYQSKYTLYFRKLVVRHLDEGWLIRVPNFLSNSPLYNPKDDEGLFLTSKGITYKCKLPLNVELNKEYGAQSYTEIVTPKITEGALFASPSKLTSIVESPYDGEKAALLVDAILRLNADRPALKNQTNKKSRPTKKTTPEPEPTT